MRRRNAQVVFDGWYGRRNAGDDAFCVVAAEVARTRWGVDCAAFVGPDRDLPVLPLDARGIYPDPPRFKGHGRFAPVPAMLRAGQVVHVGGSTFIHRLTRHRDEVLLARAGLIRLHAVAVSIGPFATALEGKAVAETLSRFSTVSVRDAPSLARAAEITDALDPVLGFDVAVLLPELQILPAAPYGQEPRRSRPVLGVSVCADASRPAQNRDHDRRRQINVQALLTEVVRRTGAAVRVLVFNDHPHSGDLEVSLNLVQKLEKVTEVEVVTRSPDVRHLYAAVASCDAVVGTRLHSAVFAYACGVPFAIVAYQQKCADFAAEVGLPDTLLFPAHGPNPGEDAPAVAALLDDPSPRLRASLPLSDAQQRAKEAFPDLATHLLRCSSLPGRAGATYG